jgi:peptide deformylase
MTLSSVLIFPDPRLRMTASTVTLFDEALRLLADDLVAAMRAAPAIGIAAPHFGVMQRIVAIALPDAGAAAVYVNPRVVWSSPERTRHQEGSVSMPGVVETIERPARVRVSYQDIDGASHLEEADGLLAVCLQHEIDQLDGIFWIQRLSKLKRDRLVRRFEKLYECEVGKRD